MLPRGPLTSLGLSSRASDAERDGLRDEEPEGDLGLVPSLLGHEDGSEVERRGRREAVAEHEGEPRERLRRPDARVAPAREGVQALARRRVVGLLDQGRARDADDARARLDDTASV